MESPDFWSADWSQLLEQDYNKAKQQQRSPIFSIDWSLCVIIELTSGLFLQLWVSDSLQPTHCGLWSDVGV